MEKNIPVELVYIPLDTEAPDWYKAINPRETVPAAQLQDGTIILESMFVAKYFDEAYEPKNSLMTNDPITRARINAFIDGLGPFIGGCYQCLFTDGDEASAKANAIAATAALEATVAAMSDGPFVLGNEFSMADVAIVPFLDRFRYTLPGFRGLNILSDAPRLQRLLQAAFLRRSVWSTSLTELQYLDAYGSATRVLKNPPRWIVTAPAGSASLAAIKVLLQWLGDVKAQIEVRVDEKTELTTIELPSGEALVDTSTPPMIILEYLAEQFNALQPASPVDRSRGRLAADIAKSLVSDDESDVSTASNQITKLITGPYIFGNQPTLYDAATAPLIAKAISKNGTKVSATIGAPLVQLLSEARRTPNVAVELSL